MISITDKSKCCGCTACANVCPKKCISMQSDEEGFSFPTIDKSKCINCNLCERVCPIANRHKNESKPPQVFYGYNKNHDVLMQSSSGGVFSSLAEYVLSQGGVVFGAMFDDNLKVRHGYIENASKLNKIRGSKYVQSDMNICFSQAKDFLLQGRLVLFTGTPCQIAGFKRFLQKDYSNLITQDFICHGVPSPMVWEKYKNQQVVKYNSKLTMASFRDKPTDWLNYHVTMEFENGQKSSVAHAKSEYIKMFLSNKCLRDSCYRCVFKGKERDSDITLADFWGANIIRPKTYNKMGTSLIIINSKKGSEIFDSIKQHLEYKQIGLTLPALFNPSFSHSTRRPGKRESFMKKIKDMSFDEAYKKSH